jgi:spermidine/putrescine transport system substrate-binding protein
VKPLVDLGYAAALDQSQIPNLANLYPEATQLAYDPGSTHSVPYTWGTTGICYRTDLLGRGAVELGGVPRSARRG